jgi:hypothetical protein
VRNYILGEIVILRVHYGIVPHLGCIDLSALAALEFQLNVV